MLENKFEKALWNTRFIVIIAVIMSILSSITLFFIGGWEIIQETIINNPLFNEDIKNSKLMMATNLGHMRTLTDDKVIETIEEFIS